MTQPPAIRRATATDAPALAALWNPWITVTFASIPKTSDDLARMIATNPSFFTTDDTTGFATYGQFRAGNGYATCMEHTVILSPDARGHGLGRALMQAVEQHARSHGSHQMIAAISAENPAAINFHAKIGYHPTATIARAGYKFGRHIDLVLMQKFL